jgi:hypothetical protein
MRTLWIQLECSHIAGGNLSTHPDFHNASENGMTRLACSFPCPTTSKLCLRSLEGLFVSVAPCVELFVCEIYVLSTWFPAHHSKVFSFRNRPRHYRQHSGTMAFSSLARISSFPFKSSLHRIRLSENLLFDIWILLPN